MHFDCGDVRSRTSYNVAIAMIAKPMFIAVTFDLGRVTTGKLLFVILGVTIAVTSDLGRVTTSTVS